MNIKMNEARDSRYIYQNELDEAYVQHDMVYEGFKDLNNSCWYSITW